MTNRLVVVGLDGATFRLLDRLMDEGRLPTLAGVAERGVRGTLESVLPPISCPAWFCYSTGKNPGKLGIYGWRNFDPRTNTDRFNDYKQLESPEIWDYVGQAGYRSAVINIPTMFPPKAIEGYMVSGMQAEEHQAYTHPPELKEELKDAYDYRVAPKHKLRWDYEEAYEEALELFEKRFDAALHLLDRVDLVHVTIFHIDEIQHVAWGTDDLDRAWERIDELLADFLDELPEDTDVLFMSDHGFAQRATRLNINAWLEKEGYLVRTGNPVGEALRRVGINRERLQRYLKRFGAIDLAKKVTPDALQKVVKEEDGSTSNQRRLPEIDWDETTAFASTHYTMHVLEEDLVDEIKAKLEALENPHGELHFDQVHRGDKVLHGDRMAEAPQLVFVPADGNAVGDGLGTETWTQDPETAGGHAMDGILLADGPSFRDGARIESARLVDLAPTILHAMGLPVPKDVDGQVLEIFEEMGEVRYTEPATEHSSFGEGELEEVEERLRGLGYLE